MTSLGDNTVPIDDSIKILFMSADGVVSECSLRGLIHQLSVTPGVTSIISVLASGVQKGRPIDAIPFTEKWATNKALAVLCEWIDHHVDDRDSADVSVESSDNPYDSQPTGALVLSEWDRQLFDGTDTSVMNDVMQTAIHLGVKNLEYLCVEYLIKDNTTGLY